MGPAAMSPTATEPPADLERALTRCHVTQQAERTLRVEDPMFLRGAAVCGVLRGCGRPLSIATWRPEYFDLSAPVDRIDTFISHNNETPRHRKFLALALHFNLAPAFAVAAVACSVTFVLTIYGMLPVLHRDGGEVLGFFCQLVGLLAFLATLMGWHEVAPLLGFRGPTVFLDRVCVHQTDRDLKRRGIESLPALIAESTSLLVLYTDVYLKKVWTIYEVATFLLLFPLGRLDIQPLIFPIVVLSGLVLACAGRVLWLLVVAPLDGPTVGQLGEPVNACVRLAIRWLMYLPLAIVYGGIQRWWARERHNMEARARAFSIRSATCLREEDRIVVERNMAIFAVHFDVVPSGSQKGDALSAFDGLVQRDLPRALRASLGRVGLPYAHAVAIFVIFVPYAMDLVAAHFRARHLAHAAGGAAAWAWAGEGRYVAAMTLHALAMAFALGPLSAAVFFFLQRCVLGFRGFRGVAAMTASSLVALTIHVLATFFLADRLAELAAESDLALGLFAASDATLLVLAWTVYQRPARVPSREPIGKDEVGSGPEADSEADTESVSGLSEPTGSDMDSNSNDELRACCPYA